MTWKLIETLCHSGDDLEAEIYQLTETKMYRVKIIEKKNQKRIIRNMKVFREGKNLDFNAIKSIILNQILNAEKVD
ncbi:MAG: hypothetical protein GF353_04075 [Candidatus Lokiarchaeota archaeon]|nr:hypothetical protein [Candidatus Lokiarchaeota archaeon]